MPLFCPRQLLCPILLLICLLTRAQQPAYQVRRLRLPPELAYYDNQFSGLAVSQGQLLLLSESRLQDQAEAKLYAVPLADLNRQLADSTYALPYRKLPLQHLPALRARMAAAGQRYEGLEALLVVGNVVYLSVETDTPSPNCYLLKGYLRPATVELDTTFLVPLPKPLAAGGAHIYNAGFEALGSLNKQVLAFFEYNYFPGPNYAYRVDRAQPATPLRPVPLPRLPFRITDATATSRHHFTAVNFFFKGEGGDTIYRTPAGDPATPLIQSQSGYQSYCRLLDFTYRRGQLSWRPLWELPAQYWGYNWEGIAAYRKGYFLLNDKYTPARPYQTVLLYLQPVPAGLRNGRR